VQRTVITYQSVKKLVASSAEGSPPRRHRWSRNLQMHGGDGAFLSGGARIDDEIAQVAIKNPRIVGVGDALPPGSDIPAQTWCFAEKESA
jgi:hypothetical protein